MSVRTAPASSAASRVRPVWSALAAAAVAIALVGGLVTAGVGDDVTPFFLQPVVLVLAAGAAYLFDDDARPVTDVVPRSLLRRRVGIVLPALSVTAAAWGAVAWVVHSRSPSAPLAALTWELAGLTCLILAAAAVVARLGEREPGNLVASGAGLLLVGGLLAQPVLHLRLLATTGDAPVHAGWWAGLVVLSCAATVVASHDPAGGG